MAVGPATTLLRSSTRTPVNGGGKKLKIAWWRKARQKRQTETMGWLMLTLALAASAPIACGQDPAGPATNAGLRPPSVSEKWQLFENETFAPFTVGAAAFNAGVSQMTHSTPLYGRNPWPAYPKRFGSGIGDIVSQNFFGDFLLASAFHEDTRYLRRGPAHTRVARIAYAISRSVVTSTDSGEATPNWSNILGTAMSAGLSNAYYPPASRTARAAATNWGTDVAGAGLANLLPEFWPDFRSWIKRHLPGRH